MAKGKKSSSTKSSSKGERANVSGKTCTAVRSARRADILGRQIDQQRAWSVGKRVMLSIPNPNDKELNKPFIRVLATDVWGDPKGRYVMKSKGSNSETA